MSLKHLNILLALALLLMGGLVVRKLLQSPNVMDQAPQEIEENSQASLITEPVTNQFLDTDRLARGHSGEVLSEEEIDIRYEELKFDRAVEALRTHRLSELRQILLDGIDYSLLPEGSEQRLKAIAEEEGLPHALEGREELQ